MMERDDPRRETLRMLLKKSGWNSGETIPDELALKAGFTRTEIHKEKETARRMYEESFGR